VRNTILAMIMLGGLWMSLSQAQSRLEAAAPLPANKQLVISFHKRLTVPASSLNGLSLAQVEAETRGRFSFSGGKWLRVTEAEKIASSGTATVCSISFVGDFTEGAVTSRNVEFRNLPVYGEFPVNGLFYSSSWSSHGASVTAAIPLTSKDIDLREATPVQISVTRTLAGGEFTPAEMQRLLNVTPASLRDCFGENVDVFEVPGKTR
jgi:hypothetical protein